MNTVAAFDLNKLLSIDITWDVIIIGTGMGGATAGYRLAAAGKKVLFLESGIAFFDKKNQAIFGTYPEELINSVNVDPKIQESLYRRTGKWPTLFEDEKHAFFPFLGCGSGGSSAIYGMALERFLPDDFTPKKNHRDQQQSTCPEKWPISFNDLRPYYELAEKLYGVKGSLDPLKDPSIVDPISPAPPLSNTSQKVYDLLKNEGLHPYTLPRACEFVEGCRECQGFLCPFNCKNDSCKICIIPALEKHQSCLLDQCEVIRVEGNDRRVTKVFCRKEDKEFILKGNIIILAAGAIQSPRILLNSACLHWPKGLGNSFGWVGKNLMRHCIDLYVLKFRSPKDRMKELAFNDFLMYEGMALGGVQAFGRLPPSKVIARSLASGFHNRILQWGILSMTPFFDFLLKDRMVLATTLEDLPYLSNQLIFSGQERRKTTLHYQLHPYEKERIKKFREIIKKKLGKYIKFNLLECENNERIAHACGTCRFGNDPEISVLDVDNRIHGMENIYIVDSSFFPTSGVANPALTIAANALRVADKIIQQQ